MFLLATLNKEMLAGSFLIQLEAYKRLLGQLKLVTGGVVEHILVDEINKSINELFFLSIFSGKIYHLIKFFKI